MEKPMFAGQLLVDKGIVASFAQVRQLTRRGAVSIDGKIVRDTDSVQIEEGESVQIKIGRREYTYSSVEN